MKQDRPRYNDGEEDRKVGEVVEKEEEEKDERPKTKQRPRTQRMWRRMDGGGWWRMVEEVDGDGDAAAPEVGPEPADQEATDSP